MFFNPLKFISPYRSLRLQEEILQKEEAEKNLAAFRAVSLAHIPFINLLNKMDAETLRQGIMVWMVHHLIWGSNIHICFV